MSPAQNTNIPLVLVGNSLSVLIAATVRAEKGLKTVIVNPGGHLGGYFAGIQALGRLQDAGMVLYELSSLRHDASVPPLESYNPMGRNDVGRFSEVVRRYVSSLHDIHTVPQPMMWADGKMLPDMILSNGISALPMLSNASTIRDELIRICRTITPESRLWHPANKGAWPLDGTPTADWASTTSGNEGFNCDTVSRRIHGETLHECVFSAFSRQVMNTDASSVAALYHRLPWLPMYWPQTLLSVLEGRTDNAVLPTFFSHPVGSTVAHLCRHLESRAHADPLIHVIQDRVTKLERNTNGFSVHTAQSGMLQSLRLGWALPPNMGVAAAGHTPDTDRSKRLPLMLCFLKLRPEHIDRECSVVYGVANDTGLYRITNSTLCGAPSEDGDIYMVAEANPDRFAAHHGSLLDDQEVVAAVCRDLAHMGLIRRSAKPVATEIRRFAGARPVPTHESVQCHLQERQRLMALLPGLEPLGVCAGPFSVGLADHIVQGLQLAKRPDTPEITHSSSFHSYDALAHA